MIVFIQSKYFNHWSNLSYIAHHLYNIITWLQIIRSNLNVGFAFKLSFFFVICIYSHCSTPQRGCQLFMRWMLILVSQPNILISCACVCDHLSELRGTQRIDWTREDEQGRVQIGSAIRMQECTMMCYAQHLIWRQQRKQYQVCTFSLCVYIYSANKYFNFESLVLLCSLTPRLFVSYTYRFYFQVNVDWHYWY